MKSLALRAMRSKVTGLILAFLLTTLASRPAMAYPGSWGLGVIDNWQVNDKWCWVGTIQSSLWYFGKQASMCDIVNAGKNITTCDNVGATLNDMIRAYNTLGMTVTGASTSLSFNTIILETYNSSRPLHALWFWNTGGGHDVLVDGYDTNGGQFVEYMDPWDGTHHTATYTWFKGGTGSGSNHNWLQSIYQIR